MNREFCLNAGTMEYSIYWSNSFKCNTFIGSLKHKMRERGSIRKKTKKRRGKNLKKKSKSKKNLKGKQSKSKKSKSKKSKKKIHNVSQSVFKSGECKIQKSSFEHLYNVVKSKCFPSHNTCIL